MGFSEIAGVVTVAAEKLTAPKLKQCQCLATRIHRPDGTAFILLVLGSQVASRMEALRSAPQDNAQWNLAQLDVELLALEVAAQRARQAGPESLTELRKRFDVYYSRVNTIHRMSLFTDNLAQKESADSMVEIRSTLDRLVPLIDGPDVVLRAQLVQITDRKSVV